VVNGLSAPEILVALLAVSLGAVVQGSVGFGFGFVAVPAMTLIKPDALPATLLLLGFPMVIVMALRERRAIDFHGFFSITCGRAIGTLAGVWLLTIIVPRFLSALLGVLILVGVAMNVLGARFKANMGSRLVAGMLSGTMATASAIGGPPLALVYQDRPSAELRSTLALSFAIGAVMSLAGLTVAGQVRGWQILLALQLAPALAVGLWLSRYASHILSERWMRPAVLIFAAVGGLLAVSRTLIGGA
jgi:uncharacterized membrane protein YfcA